MSQDGLLILTIVSSILYCLLQVAGLQFSDKRKMMVFFILAYAISLVVSIVGDILKGTYAISSIMLTRRITHYAPILALLGFFIMLYYFAKKDKNTPIWAAGVFALLYVIPMIPFNLEFYQFSRPSDILLKILGVIVNLAMFFGFWHANKFISRCYLLPRYLFSTITTIYFFWRPTMRTIERLDLTGWSSIVTSLAWVALFVSCLVAIIRFIPKTKQIEIE